MEAPKTVDDFYVFKAKNMWTYFKGQHFSFWMICAYLFFEFVRPQALFPVISVIPWAQLFLVGALLGAFTDSTVKHVSTAANIYVSLFLISILISIPLAFRPEISMLFLMEFVSWIVVFFLITRIINTKERFYIFFLIYLLAAGKIAIGTAKSWAGRGFSFADWGLMGPIGYFQNSGELAILMLMLFPLAFYLYQSVKNKIAWWERLLLILFWICPILTILGASSRGAQVALVFQLLIMFRKSIFRFKALLGISVLITSMFFLLPEEQKQRFSSAGEDRTSQQRLLYWENGWDMMLDHPLTGVGFFNFIPYFEAYYPEDMLYKTAQLPHNIFIQVGTDAGFIALFIFMLIIFYSLRIPIKIYKNPNNDIVTKAISAGLGYGVLGFVIAGQFVTVAYYPFLWIHIAFIVALLNISRKRRY